MIYALSPEVFDYFPDKQVVDFALDVFPALLDARRPVLRARDRRLLERRRLARPSTSRATSTSSRARSASSSAASWSRPRPTRTSRASTRWREARRGLPADCEVDGRVLVGDGRRGGRGRPDRRPGGDRRRRAGSATARGSRTRCCCPGAEVPGGLLPGRRRSPARSGSLSAADREPAGGRALLVGRAARRGRGRSRSLRERWRGRRARPRLRRGHARSRARSRRERLSGSPARPRSGWTARTSRIRRRIPSV